MAENCEDCGRPFEGTSDGPSAELCAVRLGPDRACHIRTIHRLKAKLTTAEARADALSLVALEAAAMLSETNHGGLTHLRSVSMQAALESAGVPIPPNCSACPHPGRDKRIAELEAALGKAERENEAWRGCASAALASDVTLMVKPWNKGVVVGSRGLVGEGVTAQAAAIDLAAKLGLLSPEPQTPPAAKP